MNHYWQNIGLVNIALWYNNMSLLSKKKKIYLPLLPYWNNFIWVRIVDDDRGICEKIIGSSNGF